MDSKVQKGCLRPLLGGSGESTLQFIREDNMCLVLSIHMNVSMTDGVYAFIANNRCLPIANAS